MKPNKSTLAHPDWSHYIVEYQHPASKRTIRATIHAENEAHAIRHIVRLFGQMDSIKVVGKR